MKNSKKEITEGRELQNQENIRTLGEKENHKYLEIMEVGIINQTAMPEKVINKLENFSKPSSAA